MCPACFDPHPDSHVQSLGLPYHDSDSNCCEKALGSWLPQHGPRAAKVQRSHRRPKSPCLSNLVRSTQRTSMFGVENLKVSGPQSSTSACSRSPVLACFPFSRLARIASERSPSALPRHLPAARLGGPHHPGTYWLLVWEGTRAHWKTSQKDVCDKHVSLEPRWTHVQ